MKALIALLVTATATLFAQPKIEVQGGNSFDFGNVYRGEIVNRTLTIRNVGTDTLVLGRVEVSCGCTGAVASESRIGPGNTGTVAISFNSKNFSGPVDKRVTVNSNAENAPALLVRFTAYIVEEITVTPPYVWFTDIVAGQPAERTITVKNMGKVPLSITEAKTQLAGFTVKLPSRPIAPGDSAALIAVFTPLKSAPVLTDGILLKTSNPRQPEVYIQIYGTVKEYKFQ